MTNGMGYKASIGFGTETTFGTGVASTNFLELNSGGDGLGVTEEQLFPNGLSNVFSDVNKVVQGAVTVSGELTFDMRFSGWERLFRYGMGTVDITQPDGTIMGQHVFKITDELPGSLSVAVNRDICSFRAEGAMINTLNVKGNNAGLLACSFGIVAEELGTLAAETATLSTSPLVTFAMGVCTYGTGTVLLESWDFTLNNNLATDRRFIGSRFIKQPMRNGRVEVSGNLVFEFEDTAKYLDFRNNTSRALSIAYTGGSLGAGTGSYSLTFSFANIKLTSGVPMVASAGRIKLNCSFKAYAADTNTRELVVTAKNLTTTA